MVAKLFLDNVRDSQVIASIKEPKQLEAFSKTDIKTAFLLLGDLTVIKRYVDFLKAYNRDVFLHIEKIPGISYDREGLKFIAKHVKPTGIVTTKSSLIQSAKKEGLSTIQRLFLIDSDAVEHGLENAEKSQPDCLELMPAVVPHMIGKIKQKSEIPIITGGLIQNRAQMQAALDHGATAVSTGKPHLWKPLREVVQ
ncbi:glycerol-3-phosphate responsive antiterminator [Jeotgalibacillus proteolyticus]|uniref:Glycerol uptake operon antiterminator regulatory protein n=1 Tax=Jeotgalibacillus proteolyticus TaxID=2082395 RepID=A0A2S5G973_9BACL|nr:glycerol-3-phosphate responsive antiterminator [Jeotgalibacillus proteolyticus]PPA69485.1 glycerol-3-phosphate responsive antiterminator [Jeotgalibacillus proteolyticus]